MVIALLGLANKSVEMNLFLVHVGRNGFLLGTKYKSRREMLLVEVELWDGSLGRIRVSPKFWTARYAHVIFVIALIVEEFEDVLLAIIFTSLLFFYRVHDLVL